MITSFHYPWPQLLLWPISERNSAPSAACWIGFITLWSQRVVNFFFQEAFSAGSVGCWIQHPQRVLNFSRFCRVLNVSEGAEFFLTLCLSANHRVAYKKFWSEGDECLWNIFPHPCAGRCWKCTRVLNSAPYVACWIQQAAEGTEFLSETGHRLVVDLRSKCLVDPHVNKCQKSMWTLVMDGVKNISNVLRMHLKCT